MCSIFGAFGRAINVSMVERIRELARDRGRDGGRHELFELGDHVALIGHWRATPATEVADADSQPYGGIVHNGTIANDRELGNPPGAVDSMVLQHVVDRSSLSALVASLGRVRGSYAMAVVGKDRLYLATNYKPIYLLRQGEAFYFSSMERHLLPFCELGVRPQRLRPYSAIDLLTGEQQDIPRDDSRRALAICSAGLDSTTAAYQLKAEGWDVTLLHFTYGCRAESREVERIRQIGEHLSAPVVVLPIDYSQFKGASPLLGDQAIASGATGAEFAHEWVPARNLVLIAHAVAYAEANGFGAVALGNNLEEGGAYPDNEEEFTHLLDQVLDYAVHDGGRVRLLAPVGQLMKHEIVALGLRLGVPYGLTWSCYQAGAAHCGDCGPCYMRREAFRRNNAPDPTRYTA
jgi:7-cyano-7-deazaguanine synthase